ncbi:MAG: 23S rRNA (adenine(2503)-C(2))-methyltransferase RlmN [Treponema sp.]|nr:23S rRNA (adenine(2503)-C(2))-methyltransferase RlmN [Treponema sp.]
MSLSELEAALAGFAGTDPYRAKQIFARIARGASSFDEMTDLPRPLRRRLGKTFFLRGSRVSGAMEDRDGTVKLALTLADGAVVETVLLRAPAGKAEGRGRFTACLSSQAGCPLGCVFCKTGSLGFLRNLEASEIVEQFLTLAALVPPGEVSPGQRGISRIVVMGMGEPLLNLSSLRKALEILCDPAGSGFSRRRITISTAGICGGIMELAEKGPETELALSLTSAREELRRRLMPGTAGNSLARIKEALGVFRTRRGRRITLEAVLLGGINTGGKDARAFVNFARGLDAVVNLIPWNPVPGLRFEERALQPPSPKETEEFRLMLEQGGLKVTRRYRRGRGIGGACGQLGGILPNQGDSAAVRAFPSLS